MPELNFNALTRSGPRGFYQGFEQGQKEKMSMEMDQMKLDELKRDRDEMLQLQEKLKGMGQDPDLDKFLDAYIATGRPDYVKMGVEGKQKLKEQRAYANLIGGGAPTAPASVAGGAELETGGVAPTNALARPTPAAAPVNALTDQSAQTQKRINDLMTFAAQNPGMAGQAMAQARLLQDQLELAARRGPAEPADVASMRQLGFPLTQEGYEAFRSAQRQERMLSPAEEAQRVRIAAAGRAPGATVILPAQEKAEQGKRGELLVAEYSDISKAAKVAAKILPSIDANLSILGKGFETGFGTETKAAGAKVLAALGVPEAEKFATDAQVFQSKATEAVLQKQLEQKGPQTESDAQRIDQIGAQLGKTTEGNKFLLTTAKEQLKRDMEQRNFYDSWWKQNKTYDGAEDAWYSGEGGKSLFDRPALKKYLSPTAASAAIPGQAIPQAAIDALKAGRGTDAQFDQMFGAGAAKRARGGK